MKILHGTNEIASLMKTHADAQREFGHEVTTVEYAVGHMQDGDIRLYIRTPGKGIRNEEHKKKIFSQFIQEHLLDYDVYHFYFATSLYMDLTDLEILRKNRKTVVMHLCGADSQNRTPNQSIFDHFRRVYHGKTGPKPPMMIPGQHRALSMIDHSVDAFLTGSGRIDHAPRIALMPRTNRSWINPINIEEWRKRIGSVDVSDKDPNRIYILHAPTVWHTKGSDFIVPVLDRLKREGYPVELILVQGVLPSRVHELYARADIVVEQILSGWYSSFACEMMSIGKPVVCRIDPYLKSHLGLNPPLVHADPHTLYDELVRLIENPSLREQIGRDEMAYAEEIHDHRTIGKDLLELYDALHHGRPVVHIPNPDFYLKNESSIQPFWPTPLPENPTYEEMILQKRVNSFQVNLQQAQVYINKGWMHRAIPFLERCVELNPDFLEGIQKLATLFLDRFRYKKAFHYFRMFLDRKPDASSGLRRLAEQRLQEERYHDGLLLLDLLAEYAPRDKDIHLLKARTYLRIGELQRAENVIQPLLEDDPGNPSLTTLLIQVYREWGKTRQAQALEESLQAST